MSKETGQKLTLNHHDPAKAVAPSKDPSSILVEQTADESRIHLGPPATLQELSSARQLGLSALAEIITARMALEFKKRFWP